MNIKKGVIYGAFLALAIPAAFFTSSSTAHAWTLGTSAFVQYPVPPGRYVFTSFCDDYRHVDLGSFAIGVEPSPISWSNYYARDVFDPWPCLNYAGEYYSHRKHVYCPAGKVMTGLRFYEFNEQVDDEKVEPTCASVSGLTVSNTGIWVTPPNPNSAITGTKVAMCPANYVATGVMMWGQKYWVDDEHVDIYCSLATGWPAGVGGEWVSPPNALDTLYGGYKIATCSPGGIVVGLGWYQVPTKVDDEHVSISCNLPPTPSVNIYFSS